jgi:hypothetical protein
MRRHGFVRKPDRQLAKKVDQRILQAMGGDRDDFLDRLQEIIAKLQPPSTD